MTARIEGVAVFLAAFVTAASAALCMIAATHSHPARWLPPEHLNNRQRIETPAYFTIPPLTIMLHFQPAAQFAKENPQGYIGVTEYNWPGHPLCEIRVPAGHIIKAWPDIGFAAFENANDGPNLAHEIFHCIAGDWHPEWPDMKHRASVTEYYGVNIDGAKSGYSLDFDFAQSPDPRDLQ